jgi:outer membrane protein W
MKKVLLSLLLSMTVIMVFGQTNKGDWMIGGNIRVNTAKSNNEFTIQPIAGYFFAKSFAAGTEFKLSYSKFGAEKSRSIGIGPFARYYFNLNNSSFKPLVHSTVTFESVNTNENGTESTNTVTSIYILGGAAYFINENVAIEALAGYNRSKYENQDSEGGFVFRFGFQVHLLGKEVRTITTY